MELTKNKKPSRRSKVSDVDFLTYGQVPPQSRDLEDAILGAIMLDISAFDTVVDILQPDFFYSDANQKIFKSMVSLQQKNMPIDLLTVVEELKKMEELDAVGGIYYVSKLTNHVVSAANIETHATIVLQKYILRELIKVGTHMIKEAYDDSCNGYVLMDDIEANLFSLSYKNQQSNYVSANTASVKAIQHLEKLRSLKIEIHGVPSGFISIDKLTGGWQNPDLIIIAARPSVGKTALALNIARNAAASEKPAGFFSLEMSTLQCMQRLVSAESGIMMDKILKPYKLEDEELKKLYKEGFAKVANLPLYIDDTPGLSIYQLRSKARVMVKKHKVKIIFIDYLQLMSGIQNGRADNREQEISKISRDLKGLAKELDIPIIALSQLSREVEKRKEGNKIPQLSDLRESGAIEQDADVVMFLYRPEYYGIHVNDKGQNNNGETHVKFAKHRSGALDTLKLRANLSIQKFTDIEDEKNQQSKEPDPFPVDLKEQTKFINKGSKIKLEDVPDPDSDEYNFEEN